jgi:CBS domain-containing protein
MLTEDDTAMRAIEVMVEHRSGAVLVGDVTDVRGIFSERDVMSRIVLAGKDPDVTLLGEVMTTNITVAKEDIDLNDAIYLMSEKRIRHLPVIKVNGEMAGMISLRYLLHDRINDLVNEIHSLEGYLNDAPGG